jgi:hypothetical protein
MSENGRASTALDMSNSFIPFVRYSTKCTGIMTLARTGAFGGDANPNRFIQHFVLKVQRHTLTQRLVDALARECATLPKAGGLPQPMPG